MTLEQNNIACNCADKGNSDDKGLKVQIVGAGPGATDLITVRGFKALENADFVLYAGSLVNEEHLKICSDACVCKDSADLNLEQQVELMAEYAKQGKNVVRLHTGDPAMYGAINEQIRCLAQMGIGVDIVPGVSSVFGAAAALGCELTAPEISQTVVLTRTPGRTPMPSKEKASSFAKTGATLVFFLSTGKIDELMQELHHEGELPLDTPAAVVYKATWAEQRIFRGTIADIGQQVQDAGFGRQALIFVGKAIGISNENSQLLAVSKLYAKDFSHGYRNALSSEAFSGNCALYAFTGAGLARAKEIAYGLKLPMEIYAIGKKENFEAHDHGHKNKHASIEVTYCEGGKLAENVRANWQEFDAHIFVGASGIAVRAIAPLLKHKSQDPAVITCPESGSHIVSLVSGHMGGANRLAKRIARITGGQAVISTATDINFLPAFDEVAMQEKARIINPSAIKELNSALLSEKQVSFMGNKDIYNKYYNNSKVVFADSVNEINSEYLICWDFELNNELNIKPENILNITNKAFSLGVGCRKDLSYELLKSSLNQFLEDNSLDISQIAKICSCSLKENEAAILELAKEFSLPTEFYPEENLNIINVPNPSQNVADKIGTVSVCEAASLMGASYPKTKRPYICKTSYASSLTFAVSRLPHGELSEAKTSGELLVVGLGSGSMQHITPEVIEALEYCDTIAGYTPYVDFIRPLVAHKNIIQNGMMGEVPRCQKALEEVAKGHKVCMVCSGDPGILAMAGLLMELRHNNPEFTKINIKVMPGITSANIAAASLGAPLQNGFCLVSLSDLLVPGDEVRQNIRAVANSALPVALYNPAGKKRRAIMAEALEIFADARGDVLCAYVKNAGRDTETKWIGSLNSFPQDEVDMSTLLIIGGPRTKFDGDYLYEARGYIEKYIEK